MLESPQDESVVRWGDNGDSFVVLENEKFTKHILPKHFKHSNFASFVRQLNKYDFHKVRQNNEDSGQSPYGPGAWEFKHPDFKANNKDALDNIRRKAPAPRKPGVSNSDELVIPTQQMDMMNGQLVAMQQQLQTMQDRNYQLETQYNILLNEFMGMTKTVLNHDHVLQQVMGYLNGLDAQRRRDSRLVTPFPGGNQQDGQTNQAGQQQQAEEEDTPASPLLNAAKLMSENHVEALINPKNLEQMNQMSMRAANGTLTTPPPELYAHMNGRPSSRSAQHSASSSTSARFDNLDNLVYPVGVNNGIDPMYSEHIHNIPYTLPVKPPESAEATSSAQNSGAAQRKKSTHIDPGWIRQPQILLVEDDPTCRRIGGKFLYAFNCAIDNALDGLEAVNKIQSGAKYDLVLMDIIMPNLDGVSACHLIRQFSSTPVIAMTSNIRSDDIEMYFRHGMNDVLPKPFTKEGLLHMLEKHLAHLKQPVHNLDMGHPTSAGLQPSSGRTSMKEEESPAKSPATGSTWNSPSQVPGVSPVTSTATEEGYGQMGQPHPGLYAVQNPMQQVNPMTGGGQMQFGQQSGLVQQQQRQTSGQHRRQISDISGGADEASAAKRQQMYPPNMQQNVPPHMRGR
ncbi:hypothetical protein, variant 1 [Verruconis gallopava]|nr:hypothetical protein, variant 1 [Verruconis gallopava]KIW05589.1 hypothetical protein, variant 1 [Verruconis gallopava]